jgi:hypothetical protein
MDVHQASISIAVSDAAGKVLMECILETKAATVLEFIQGLRGSLSVTFEEGTSAAWLYDLLKPHVAKVVVCDPPASQSPLLRTEKGLTVSSADYAPFSAYRTAPACCRAARNICPRIHPILCPSAWRCEGPGASP